MLRLLSVLLLIFAAVSWDGYNGNSADISSSARYITTGPSEGPSSASYSTMGSTEAPSSARYSTMGSTEGPSLSPPLLPLVPYPQSLTLDEECAPAVIDPLTFLFVSNTPSQLLDKVFVRYSRYLNLGGVEQRASVTLRELDVQIKDPSEVLEIGTSESYNLVVTFQSATLKADTVYGAMRGLETFSQLVDTNYTVPCLEITDFPRYQFRGFMLDTSRHFLSVGVLKAVIRSASWSKLNVFHWHIVDDPSFPYCSRAVPGLCQKGAYSPDHTYSLAQVREVVVFAKEHGILVVPEFDTPGHALSWGGALPGLLTHCPGKGNIGSEYGPIDPTNEAVYPILKSLLTEVREVFEAEFVHLGGDEVHYGCWKTNENITDWMEQNHMQGDYQALENYYETQLLKIANSISKNYIVWEEIYKNNLDITPQTIVHAWLPNWREVFQNATSTGHRVILSAGWYIQRATYGEDWKKFYQQDPASFNTSATAEQQALVLGGTACMWGEYVDNTNVLSRFQPRVNAVGERLWSAASMNDVDLMQPRLDASRCRAIARGYPAEPSFPRGYCPTEWKWRNYRRKYTFGPRT